MKERQAYDRVFPLYFPRSKPEECRATVLLPADTGNEFGETVGAGRQVRVGASYVQGTGAAGPHGRDATEGQAAPGGARQIGSDLTGYEEHDWLEPGQDPTAEPEPETEADVHYSQLLARASARDFPAIAQRCIVYRAGVDKSGLPVFVFIARNLLLEEVDLGELALYLIKVRQKKHPG